MIRAIAVPALIALVFKLGLLIYSMKLATSSALARLVQVLLVVFVLHNSVEFVGLARFDGEVNSTIAHLGFAYLLFTILAATLILHLSLRLSFDFDSESSWVRLQPVLYVPGFALLYLLLATDRLVIGFQTYESTVLRIPGPWYILFEGYVASYVLAALLSLVCGARGSRKSAKGRSRNRLWLLALFPTGGLILYLIVANHLGAAKITSTIYLPIPWALFLLVATYSVYHNRLPDIGVLIPGSKARRRKAALYERTRTMGADIGKLRSAEDIVDVLTRIFRCSVALVGDHTALRTAANDGTTRSRSGEKSERFPEEVLRKVRQIVVLDEIEETDPELRALMNEHRVEAIVPFRPHGTGSMCWALFGERFGTEVYTPLDFKHVENLFHRIEKCLGENVLPLRAQVHAAVMKLDECKYQLAATWSEIEALRREVDLMEAKNRHLSENSSFHQGVRKWQSLSELPEQILSGRRTLQQHLAEIEARALIVALKRSSGDEAKAAWLLGITTQELRYLIGRHGLPQ